MNVIRTLKPYIFAFYNSADSDFFAKFEYCSSAEAYPHDYRCCIHIAALQGARGLAASTPVAVPVAPANAKKEEDNDFYFLETIVIQRCTWRSSNDMLVCPNEDAENHSITNEAKQRSLFAIDAKNSNDDVIEAMGRALDRRLRSTSLYFSLYLKTNPVVVHFVITRIQLYPSICGNRRVW